MFSKLFEKCEEHFVSKNWSKYKVGINLNQNEEFVLGDKLDEEDKILRVYCLL